MGIDVMRVQEIIRYQEMTKIPLMPPEVHGLINLRGDIVTAIDLRKRLGLPCDTDWRPTNIVVRVNGDLVSLLVDQVGEVLELDATQCETPPDTLSKNLRPLIDGVFKLDRELLLIFNLDKVSEAEGALR